MCAHQILDVIHNKITTHIQNMSQRSLVLLDDTRVPLTPLDDCWAEDGRVYVRFAGSNAPRSVGTLSNLSLTGYVRLKILASAPYEIPVESVVVTEKPLTEYFNVRT